MRKIVILCIIVLLASALQAQKSKPDSNLVAVAKGKTNSKKPPAAPAKKEVKEVKEVNEVKEIVLPVPEFINQPYYYNKDENKLVRLENTTAKMNSKKKTFGLGGGKQFFSMDGGTSKIRFNSAKNLSFLIKTNGDEIDLTSFIKLFKFTSAGDKREVVINSNGGILNSKSEEKSTSISLNIKKISPGNYMVAFADPLAAGEYGFIWVNNSASVQESTVFAFGIDWKTSD